MQSIDLENLDYRQQEVPASRQIPGSNVPSGKSKKKRSGPSCSGSTLGDGGHFQNMMNPEGVFTKADKTRGEYSLEAGATDKIEPSRREVQRLQSHQMVTRQRRSPSRN